MNKLVVLKAIAERMDMIYSKVICNTLNKEKDLSAYIKEIEELHDAYFELRGHTGSASYVQGVDSEVNNVESIYVLTCK